MMIRKDVEGCGGRLISRYYPSILPGGTKENHEKTQSGYPDTGPILEPGKYGIRSTSAKTFSRTALTNYNCHSQKITITLFFWNAF
jgi:hypothetical protein